MDWQTKDKIITQLLEDIERLKEDNQHLEDRNSEMRIIITKLDNSRDRIKKWIIEKVIKSDTKLETKDRLINKLNSL